MAGAILGDGRSRFSGIASSRLLGVSAISGAVFLWLFTPQSLVVVVGTTVQDSLVLLAVMSRLPDAVARVREERRRTMAERNAFEQFTQRVADTDPIEPRASDLQSRSSGSEGGMVAVSVGEASVHETTTPLTVIREAYRETVMDVSHYGEEYAESLEENMAAEFGPEIARAVTDGEILTPQLRVTLVQRSLEARKQREQFLQTLADEREAVSDARRTLRNIHTRVDDIEDALHRRSARELIEDWKRLASVEETCADLLAERQSHLQQTVHGRTPFRLQTYLYPGRSWTFPVLNDNLDCISRIRTTKRRVVKEMSKWR